MEGLPGLGRKGWAVVRGAAGGDQLGTPFIFHKERELSAGASGRGFPTEMEIPPRPPLVPAWGCTGVQCLQEEAGAGLSQLLRERETAQHLVKGLVLNLMH